MASSSPPQFCTIITEKRDTMHVGAVWSVLKTPEHVLSIEINWIDRKDLRAVGSHIITDRDEHTAPTDIAILIRWAGMPRAAAKDNAPIPVTVKKCEKKAVCGEGWHRVPEGTILLFWVKYAIRGQETWYSVRWAREAFQDLRWREDKFKVAKQCRDSSEQGEFIPLEKMCPGYIDSRLRDLDLANPKWGLPAYARYLTYQRGRATRGWKADAVGQDAKTCRQIIKNRSWKEQEQFIEHFPLIKQWYIEIEGPRRAAKERKSAVQAPPQVISVDDMGINSQTQSEEVILSGNQKVLTKDVTVSSGQLGYGRKQDEQVIETSHMEDGDARRKEFVINLTRVEQKQRQNNQPWEESAVEGQEDSYQNAAASEYMSHQLSLLPAEQMRTNPQPGDTFEMKHLLELMDHATATMEHDEQLGGGMVGDDTGDAPIVSHLAVMTSKFTERRRRFPPPGSLYSYFAVTSPQSSL